jgi:hypothetical protein
MQNKKIKNLEEKILKLKRSIADLKDLRPGTVSEQIAGGPNRKPRKYWQISYTHKMRSKTDYIRDEMVPVIKRETEEYKKFKKIVDKIIELSIKLSKEKIEMAKNMCNQTLN